ncbi:hypothetical protein ACPOL_2882 [Acidisarcina polymorpha]|uniref:Uncharacterized protein n=1 Tax=Acidisarcina polymorpha TaxID=2211140 RepID=A0A2Z5G0T5_9BACT|nr:hypothetical protein [Acidisarcina polymorpha]AXC12186.1 hypothetical protein ACPOL_2882 [Acidisarcina polymorpha]
MTRSELRNDLGTSTCRAAGELGPEAKRDEGREKPKGARAYCEPSRDKTTPDKSGPEWIHLGGFQDEQNIAVPVIAALAGKHN